MRLLALPAGLLRVTFNDGDVYQWNKVSLCQLVPVCASYPALHACTGLQALAIIAHPKALLTHCWRAPRPRPAPHLQVTTSINNLILGKIYIDHGGIMKVGVGRAFWHPALSFDAWDLMPWVKMHAALGVGLSCAVQQGSRAWFAG